MVDFPSMPENFLTPGVHIEIDNSQANQGLPVQPHKILVIGQMLATGTATADTLIKLVTAPEAVVHFGRGSMLAAMVARLKGANNLTEAWAIPMADLGAGAQAAGDITFTGPATASGTLVLYVAFRRLSIGVSAGDTATEIAAAVQAAIAADLDMVVTAAVNGVDDTQVDITSRHKGEMGNDIDLRVNFHQGEALPAGVGVAITAMSGGTGNPDIAAAIAEMADEEFNTIVMPWTDAANLTLLETELADRFGPMRQIMGHAFAARRGTVSALGTFGDGRNSPHVSTIGTATSPSPPWEWAAGTAGIVALYGGNDPARPFQTLALPGIAPPVATDRPTREERNLLLQDSISTFTVDSGGVVRIDRLVTMYNLDSGGLLDRSYLDVNTMYTLSRLRYQLRARIQQKFPRHKLADDGNLIGPGQAVVTPSVIRAELVALADDWIAAGLVENIGQFKTDMIVERSPDDPNRIDALIAPDLINQLRFFAGLIQFRL